MTLGVTGSTPVTRSMNVELDLTEDQAKQLLATSEGWRMTPGQVLMQHLKYAPGSPILPRPDDNGGRHVWQGTGQDI
jgi:hypothetical protein